MRLRSLRRFITNRTGATVIVFALALIPVLGIIGAAIDFSRAHIARTHLQGAIDAAVLAAATGIQQTDSERVKLAKRMFKASMKGSNLIKRAKPNIEIGSDGGVKGTVSGRLNSVVLGLFGINKLDVSVAAEVMSGRLIDGEIVLVLDYSGSMNSNGKYQAMRDAAIDLIRTISRDYTIPSVRFGLVPFSGHVYGSIASDYIINEAPGSTWTNCTRDRGWSHNIGDTTPFVGDDESKWGLAPGGGGDDDDDDDDDDGGSGDPYGVCSNYPDRDLVIEPLTDQHRRIVNKLRRMTPYQMTHIAAGLEFGWHVLSPNAPWQEGVAYNTKNTIKSIVLLTDGRQTVAARGPGGTLSTANGESNLEDMCEAIKAQNVLMITVAFDLQDADTENRLRDCATSSAYFFDADTNAELSSAFESIAMAFAKDLHLSK